MKMTTPIVNFIQTYKARRPLRLHMPGHKGVLLTGYEHDDITEVAGADSLYEAEGIIRESERNASLLFGCPTYYSTEGSSQCIRAMLYLVMLHTKEQGIDRPLILAGRNAHKTFLSAVGLLDLDVEWLYPENEAGYLACPVTPDGLTARLSQMKAEGRLPSAVYLTSPDYLGNVADIAGIAEVCHGFGVLLVVDNAHGAYLRFLPESKHPMDLGADLCCDSAHKTLPVLTGGGVSPYRRSSARSVLPSRQAGSLSVRLHQPLLSDIEILGYGQRRAGEQEVHGLFGEDRQKGRGLLDQAIGLWVASHADRRTLEAHPLSPQARVHGYGGGGASAAEWYRM